jgi:diguanylate cyclase (GGDEF)-like protein/PAS domain S-box-containing protein
MSGTARVREVQSSPATRRQRRGTGLPLLVGAILLAGATAYAIASLRAHADERREAQVLLGSLHAGVEAHTAVVWEAVAAGGDGAPAGQLDALRGRIDAGLNELALVDPGEPMLLALMRAFGQYDVATSDVLASLAAPAPEASGAVRAMRASSLTLAGLIDEADRSYRASAGATSSAADIGTTTTLVSAAILLALLFRRSERARRTAVVLAHEQRVLRYSEERFRALVQRSTDMTTVIDLAGIVRYQSPSGQRMLGQAPVELIGRTWRSLLHDDDAPRATELLEASAAGRAGDESIKWRLRRADGGWLDLETTVSNLLDEPSVQGIVLNSRDIGDRQDLERRLFHQAFHDALTGLPNRARFMEDLRAALARAHRRGHQVAVLLLDLDRFKNVNDSLGHAAGDQLLAGVAERLRASLRTEDTAARLAGDEFVVLVEGVAGPQDAARLAKRIAASLRRPFSIAGQTVFISGSIGIVVRGANAEPEEFLRDADVAMYRAKSANDLGYAVFEPTMHAAAVDRLQLETDLREALTSSQFSLVYQPILELAGGRVIAVEALARWRHPLRGDIPPARFIPIADETGMIAALGWWVMEKAATQLHDWRQLDPRLAQLQMSVNLSARQLHDAQLPSRLAELVDRLGLQPSALILEMTEDAFSGPAAAGARALEALRRIGFRIAIDDFGTGYSTLGRLHHLPVDMVKIDRSFMEELDGTGKPALVRAMVELSHALGLAVVAEGVETETQREALRALGCDAAQGYALGRPAEASAILAELLAAAGTLPTGGGRGSASSAA